ncbi:MAG: Gfo/Idh/MocA family oxidoreductase, partial [Betaproteobacteria bacterium]
QLLHRDALRLQLLPHSPPLSREKRENIRATVAFVGSGNYAMGVLIPAFKSAGARMKTVASSGGVSGVHAGLKHGFEQTTTAVETVFSDAEIDAVVIATRHDSHARLVCQALAAGKHVFVEKPLALTQDELVQIERAYGAAVAAGHTPVVMVGFNRRFAPQVKNIRSLLDGVKAPKAFVITVNAGAIPVDHWTQDKAVGGGRILGEACHFIDLLRFLAGSTIAGHRIEVLRDASRSIAPADKVSISLRFADGSIGTIHYLANGHRSFPKERIEVFCAGRVLQLDNFRKLQGFGWPAFRKMNLWRQDKGQRNCAKEFVNAVERGDTSPIPFDELIEVARVTILIAEAART